MKRLRSLLVLSVPLSLLAAGPDYSSGGQLKFPEGYREWVFLSSGLGMIYSAPEANQTQRFDNVFVNPEAYRSFLKTGSWPDKTVFVLEIRNSESHVSINLGGHTQGEVSAVEVEVKDSTAKPGLWTFYGFPGGNGSLAKPMARDANCYSCHAKNTAVENTFVQFYPTLFSVAKQKGTLNTGFQQH